MPDMSYCGMDVVKALGQSPTCVKVVLLSAVSQTELWVQEGQILEVSGCALEELLARLTEPNPVVKMNPVAPVKNSGKGRISVQSLDMARHQDVGAPAAAAGAGPEPKGKTISHKLKPAQNPLKKAKPILFQSGGPTSIVIGRGQECNVITEDAGASRRHCRVTFQQGTFFVQDLSSTNGTFLNGERVLAVKARAGDILSIGEDRYILMSEQGV